MTGRSVRATAPSRRPGARLRALVLHATVIVLGAFIVVPIVYGVLGGFKDNAQLAANPFGLPSPWIFSNYADLFVSASFWRPLGSSALIGVATTLLVVSVSALAAFIFARFAFRGRELIFTLFSIGLMFPFAVAILPLFILLRTFGLLDNPLGVILPQAAFGLPVTIIILRPFFHSIPSDLQDAAAIDGCGPFRFFVRILLPLSRPVLATVSVLAIVGSWNAFLLPLVVLTDSSGWTLPLGVTNYSQQYTTDTAKVLAFTTLSMVPALIFYAFAERQLIRGLTSGAVKG
jgi:raffinose/stachyose/melibiose transport system permease protein